MQPIALKAAIVPLVVGLQKPSQKSNAKDHQECLSRRLVLWKEREVDKLLREERMIQKRLSNSRRVDPLNAGRVSANLVMSGQINSALRYLSENDREGGGVVSFLKVMTSLHSSEETSKSTGSSFGFFAFRASRRCPRLNLPTGEWGNGTGCGSGNKKCWGSLRHWCEWVPANSCIKVIQEIWNRPVRSNSRNDPTLVHWIYRSLGVEEILAKSTHSPEQWRGRCPADRCQRSYTEDNGKVCYARDKARCHWRRWFPSSLCRTQKWK